MKVTYRPGDGEEQVFEFQPGKIAFKRAQKMQGLYKGLTGEKLAYDQFQALVLAGDAAARLVLLWHFLQEQHPTLRIDDLNPSFEQVLVEASVDELRLFRSNLERSRALAEWEKDQVLAAMDDEIARLAGDADLPPVDGEPGKATGKSKTSKTSSVTTG